MSSSISISEIKILMAESGVYKVGQYVYTSRDINGWFDYSVRGAIPSDTRCAVVGYHYPSDDLDIVTYEVDFGKEFGIQVLCHEDLKESRIEE